MNRKTLLILAYSFLGLWLNAQTFSPAVMSADGGESHTETLSLEWTLGEMAVDFIHTENMIISEGFHQPYLESLEVSNDLFSDQFPVNGYASGDYQITVWPNPVSTILNVKIESDTEEEITVELLDVLGRSTISKTNHLPYGSFEMDFTDKTPGMYLLRFLDKEGTLIKTILNVKH